MRVLHVNKVHFVLGGAEAVYLRTAEILESYGHSSVFFAMRHSENLPCHTDKYFMPLIDVDKMDVVNCVRASCRNLYSFKARKCISKLLDDYPVDLVHMHDIHRQMSPSILHEIKKRKIPVVMTLHNYKMICPTFLMMVNGKPCEKCTHQKYFHAVRMRCARGAFFRSMLSAVELYLHHRILNAYKNVDVFIAPSTFLKNKHKELGFNNKMVHLPYPIDVEQFERIHSAPDGGREDNAITFVYFGRLEPEKGLFTLFEAIKYLSENGQTYNTHFKIVGDGPIKEELDRIVQKNKMRNVNFIGFLKGDKLFTEIRRSDVVIIPSEWYENYPVSVMEAFALGRPVIGARIGGIPEMVRDRETGLTFESANAVDLAEKIKYVLQNPDEAAVWGKNARKFIEREVNPERHYRELMKIYDLAISLNNAKEEEGNS